MLPSLMSVKVKNTPWASGNSTSTAMTTTTGSTIAYAYQCRSRNLRTEVSLRWPAAPGSVRAGRREGRSADRVLGDDGVLVGLGDLVQRRLGVLLARQH